MIIFSIITGKGLSCSKIHLISSDLLFYQWEATTQDINESANFRSLQRLSIIFGFRQTVRDLLLPAETTVHEKWFPAEIVHVILLPAETLCRKLNHTDSLCRKLFPEHNSLGMKQEIADSLGGSQI